MSKNFPCFFFGHGSPMNIIQDNDFTRSLNKIPKLIPKPSAILVISAHYLTNGTFITSNEKPKQIYDFYGFPKELYEIEYRPDGNKKLAEQIVSSSEDNILKTSEKWGLDHASYMLLAHMFPEADIPVLEMSLDYKKPPVYHYELGEKMKFIRDMNVMIIGSGNLIHTFKELDWKQDAKPFEWALKYDELQKQALVKRDIDSLINYDRWKLSKRAFQTNEHYIPMLYILGLMNDSENIEFTFEGFQHGSISHRSFIIT